MDDKSAVRTDWTLDEIREIFNSPLLALLFRAMQVHVQYHPPGDVQLCTLLSIKTGGCTEDCAYCPQSARYQTGVQPQKLMDKGAVVRAARQAKENGSSRFCMGVAWREAKSGPTFDKILEMISEVNELGLEVCCCLGMLTQEQAEKLKQAGLHSYNHNIDTSANYYPKIITTRTFQDRLDTLQHVRNAGLNVCCGGILGMGEVKEDRVSMIHTLATLQKHPESVPINALQPIPGTPLENQTVISIWELVRTVALARIVMPKARVRLSAGRSHFSFAEQTLAFWRGPILFHTDTGAVLLTQKNCGVKHDEQLIELLGIPNVPRKLDLG